MVLVAGNDDVLESSDEDPLAELSAVDAVKELVASGLKPTAAIKKIAKQRSLDRQALYLKYQGENK